MYEGLHGYRHHARLLVGLFLLTAFVQVFKILSIWLAGKAVGVDLPPKPFFVMGPLLFLVMLMPFTLNGFAIREAFFVSFLGKLGRVRGRSLRDRVPLPDLGRRGIARG